MHHQAIDPEKLFHAYGVDLQLLYPWEGVVEPPFGAAWAILAPGSRTKVHQHQEGETFFIARGQGKMSVGGETVEVSPGSVIFQRPFQEHVLENTSTEEDLLFLTVWWEDRRLWTEEEMAKAEKAKADKAKADPAKGETTGEGGTSITTPSRRVMVTAAPPTPNGDLHLGHLAGPYLGADFHTRYLRLRGLEGHYACGSDDHCMYVERKGEQIGMSGEEAKHLFVGAIEESLELAGVDMQLFLHPGDSACFRPLTLDFHEKLRKAGKLESREAPAPYCEPCDRYLFEADISGACPHCGEGVTGNTCEACGRVNDCINLADSRCTACGEATTQRNIRRLIFPLSRYGDALTEYLRRTQMSPRLRAFCEAYLADGLPDVAVSHVSGWGIPVPGDSHPGQTLYVWFEMAARYLAYAQHLSENGASEEGYGAFWRSPEAGIVQFFGFDNSFYYALLLPALYMAFDPDLRLPEAFVTNEFFRLDGEKFSTSRGHSILGRALLAEVPRDLVRFYLAHSGPEKEETNFTLEEMWETLRREPLGAWRRWLETLGRKVREESEGQVPATGDWTPDQLRFYRQLEGALREAAEAYEPAAFSPQRLTRLMAELVRTANRFGRSEDHWKGVAERSQEWRTGLALELLAAKVLAIIAAPIMPAFAADLWRALGHAESMPPGVWNEALEWVPAGQAALDLGPSLLPDLPEPLPESNSLRVRSSALPERATPASEDGESSPQL